MRTPNEIRTSIYAACGGDWSDEDARISELQNSLVQALIWVECPPDGGWYATLNRQIAALNAMPEPANDKPFSFLVFPEASPRDIIEQISKHCRAQNPWDVDGVDEYIKTGKFPK